MSNAKTSSLSSLPPPGSTKDKKDQKDVKADSPTKTGDVLEQRIEEIISAKLDSKLNAFTDKLAALNITKAMGDLPAVTKSKDEKVVQQQRPLAKVAASVGSPLRFDTPDDEADERQEPVDVDAQAVEQPQDIKTQGGKRVADAVLEQVRLYGSLQAWVRMTEWVQQRNKYECEAIAQAVDALIKEGVPSSTLGVEILLRRLNGVHLADRYGSWEVCSAVQWSGPSNTLLPRDELTRVFKEAAQLKRLATAVPKAQSNAQQRPAFRRTNNGGQSQHASSRGGQTQAPVRSAPAPTKVAGAAKN